MLLEQWVFLIKRRFKSEVQHVTRMLMSQYDLKVNFLLQLS